MKGGSVSRCWQLSRVSPTTIRPTRQRYAPRCSQESQEPETAAKTLPKRLADSIGVSMGPISLSFSDDFASDTASPSDFPEADLNDPREYGECIHSLTTTQWRELYESDGTVDLWVEEEYNAGSRLKGGRDAHFGRGYGVGTGEGVSQGDVALHHVKIHNRYQDTFLEVEVPEDRYVLWEAEDHGLELPYACRMGCCTTCAVRVLSGEMHQPQALGISAKLKSEGYALMCVGYPRSDLVLETVNEDEVYDLQFGEHFEKFALNKEGSQIERDDFALELADMDE